MRPMSPDDTLLELVWKAVQEDIPALADQLRPLVPKEPD